MRVHIYEEEMGEPVEVAVVRTTATNGLRFLGLRVWLKGAETLQATPEDDDRSAVTFWVEEGEDGLLRLENLCRRMLQVLAQQN